MTHHLTKFEQTQTPITLHITALTHDGRGIATYDDTHGDKSGKKVFISHALPTETVTVHLTKSKKSYDEADCSGVLTPSPHRTAPICPHFGCVAVAPCNILTWTSRFGTNSLSYKTTLPNQALPLPRGYRQSWATERIIAPKLVWACVIYPRQAGSLWAFVSGQAIF